MPIDPKSWTRALIEAHSVDLRQFIDFRQSTLPNGMRIIEAYNSSGLTFTLLPDRGMDIWTAHYKGIPLSWISQGSPHPPDWGQSWLRQFNGGLLTTCGLTHVGSAEVDDITGEQRGIHGNYTRLRAENIHIGESGFSRQADIDGETYLELSISATVYDAALFGTQLRVERTLWQSNHPDIGIADVITNVGDQPVPLMLLYHFNLGFPLIQAGAKLHTAHQRVYPRDSAAAAGYDGWQTYEAASPGYPEQVFFHHLHGRNTDSSWATVLVTNAEEDFGLSLEWDGAWLPYFTQWKNTRQGMYVCGIEPGNCIPEGQNAARNNGRLQMLPPGETVETYLRLAVLDGIQGIQQGKALLARSQETGTPLKNVNLDNYAQ
jgi:hypothetical protein